MADSMTEVIEPLVELFEKIEEIGVVAQVGATLGLTLFGMLFTRYVLLKMAWKIVKQTEAEWDNEVLEPIANRLYVFILMAGVEVTMMWTLGRKDEIYAAVAPYFSAVYIVVSASIISVAIKHIVPAAMERYNTNKTVAVTGGNPLVVFSSRGLVWFLGLYLAFNEIGIELLGLLASLAVFSLIIGLAVQQTLGNMINSFMLAIDQPFEVGDRIEVAGVTGTVMSVGILSTKILTLNEQLVVILHNPTLRSPHVPFSKPFLE